MARRRHHEEHTNHESWAIPYGDLVTLLLAFFVVMYAISQVNEGKYRVLSDSLNAAFRGSPTTIAPIQVGEAAATTIAAPIVQWPGEVKAMALRQLAAEAEEAMGPLIVQGLVDVNRGEDALEISIRSDILFASGAATLSPAAQPVIRLLGEVLHGFPVSIKVEGHTDNVPIVSGAYPSNWELSAARAASVVHLLTQSGVDPARLSVLAYGEFRPVLPNTTPDGRNANRRVVLSVQGMGSETPQAAAPDATAAPAETAPATTPAPLETAAPVPPAIQAPAPTVAAVPS
jgi:chemotaxis protein MotB